MWLWMMGRWQASQSMHDERKTGQHGNVLIRNPLERTEGGALPGLSLAYSIAGPTQHGFGSLRWGQLPTPPSCGDRTFPYVSGRLPLCVHICSYVVTRSFVNV